MHKIFDHGAMNRVLSIASKVRIGLNFGIVLDLLSRYSNYVEYISILF